MTEDEYRQRRILALTRCQLIHDLGPGHVSGCCVCQNWADTFTAPPEPVECCASGRCEVCTPGHDCGRDG